MRPRAAALALAAALGLIASFALPALAGRHAEKRLEAAIAAKDAGAAQAAIREIAADGNEAAAKAIVAGTVKAAAVGLDVEEAALEALSGMTSEGVRKYLFKAAKEERQWIARFLVVAALARAGTPEAEDAVIAALEDKEPRVGAAAVRHLKARATGATVGKLIAALPKLDREKRLDATRKEVASALRDLTGVDIDATQDWKNWWAANGEGFQPKKAVAGKKGGGDDVVSRLRENHPADYKTVERLSGDDILVFKGRSDRVERVLDALEIPYTPVDRAGFDQVKLDPKQILIFNCNGKGDPLTDEQIKRVRDVVAQGAYLFSSDWEAQVLLARAFPEKISVIGNTPYGKEMVVRIRPVGANATHPYNRDVFPLDPFQQANFAWKVHERTQVVKLGEGAVALIESEDLTEKLEEPDDRGRKVPVGKAPVPVAVTFRVGDERVSAGKKGGEAQGGAVLHVLSHFQDQRTKEGDGFALQQLLLNFIVEKQRAKAKFGGF